MQIFPICPIVLKCTISQMFSTEQLNQARLYHCIIYLRVAFRKKISFMFMIFCQKYFFRCFKYKVQRQLLFMLVLSCCSFRSSKSNESWQIVINIVLQPVLSFFQSLDLQFYFYFLSRFFYISLLH